MVLPKWIHFSSWIARWKPSPWAKRFCHSVFGRPSVWKITWVQKAITTSLEKSLFLTIGFVFDDSGTGLGEMVHTLFICHQMLIHGWNSCWNSHRWPNGILSCSCGVLANSFGGPAFCSSKISFNAWSIMWSALSMNDICWLQYTQHRETRGKNTIWSLAHNKSTVIKSWKLERKCTKIMKHCVTQLCKQCFCICHLMSLYIKYTLSKILIKTSCLNMF